MTIKSMFYLTALATVVMLTGIAMAQTEPKDTSPPATKLLTGEDSAHARPTGEATETLVGRGTKAESVDRQGNVKKLDPGNVISPSSPQAPKQAAQQPAQKGKLVEKKPAEALPGAAGEPKDAKIKAAEEEAARKAKLEALKESDSAHLQSLKDQGLTWFSTTDGKPLSNEEVDKRIKWGDVAGIKTTDAYHQTWTTSSTNPEEPPTPAGPKYPPLLTNPAGGAGGQEMAQPTGSAEPPK